MLGVVPRAASLRFKTHPLPFCFSGRSRDIMLCYRLSVALPAGIANRPVGQTVRNRLGLLTACLGLQ